MKTAENLRELLTLSESQFGKKHAFLLRDSEGNIEGITYEKLRKDTEALGTALICQLGLKDKKVALIGENSYWWCLSYLAVTGGVGVIVPLDKETPAEELDNIFSFAEIDVVIADKSATEKIVENKNLISRDIKIISFEDRENTLSFSSLLSKGEKLIAEGRGEYFEAEINKDDMAVLLFTSGTTGMAKGVMLSHNNLCSDLANVSEIINVTSDDVSMSVLPLHHTYESIAFLMIISKGGAISFSNSIRRLKEDFALYKPTVFVTVPLMLEKIHKRILSTIEQQGKRKKMQMLSVFSSAVSEDKKKKLFAQIHSFFGGRLSKIIVGAAALRSEIASDFMLFGIPVVIGYGLTECSPIVICNSLASTTTDSIGKPLREVEVKIVDADEKGIGEICVKGPMVMLGYYKNKEATDEVMIDSFFHTGDLGYKDKNGNYHITGRKKNVIVTKNGKNIYPEELEYYLSKHSVISDSMVYAHSDGIVTAQIIPDENEIMRKYKKNTLEKSDIDKAITEAVRATNRKVPSYKNIKNVIIRTKDFVRTTTQKIKRGEEENFNAK